MIDIVNQKNQSRSLEWYLIFIDFYWGVNRMESSRLWETVGPSLWETAETETCKKSEPETLSAEDLEVMVLIKLNKMSENANKSKRFHTNSTRLLQPSLTLKPCSYLDLVPCIKTRWYLFKPGRLIYNNAFLNANKSFERAQLHVAFIGTTLEDWFALGRKLFAFSTMEETLVSEGTSVSNVSGKRRKRKCKFINCMFYSWL